MPQVLADWTAHMYAQDGAIHHTDVRAGAWIYRVFLLASTLQVDLAFAPKAEFRPLAETFRLVFGEAREAGRFPQSAPADLIGMAWLHALHVRSAIARGKLWQAEYMIAGVRNHALALACMRHDLPAVHARGIDRLPESVRARFEATLTRRLDVEELGRAFHAVTASLIAETECADAELAARLKPALLELSSQK